MTSEGFPSGHSFLFGAFANGALAPSAKAPSAPFEHHPLKIVGQVEACPRSGELPILLPGEGLSSGRSSDVHEKVQGC